MQALNIDLKMNIQIAEGYPAKMESIESLFRSFGDFNENVIEHSLRNRSDIIGIYAYEKDLLVGCKIGFSPRLGYFESWIGGVHKDYQCRGIATELALALQNKVKEKGYRYLETTTANDNLPMQLVNLKTGMRVVGTYLDRGNELKLRFQLELKT
ncbi:GNAT family N-acetyltransferase [Gilvimarinus sp. DA14]|uniref:GNAT family N-acetyltransferase n=1 Tax=Gilvimarinus sp. DA14 TaxID=2956798 RepID=UPI0020B71677|nr:GNAT family N-acetyltransferase [Gilvimarinus sp. DA14]UTF59606.1 GNAT family N-acetyltransferase [Gilvimarinus sp. DA14]